MQKDELKNESIRSRVEAVSNYYYYGSQQQGIDNRTKRYLFDKIITYVQGANILEFGFVDGIFTDMLLNKGCSVTIVEGATSHIQYANNKYKSNNRVKIIQSLFEMFESSERYNTVILGDMIQFLEEPMSFLRKCGRLLIGDGKLIVTTPNSRSLHRRIGAILDSKSPEAISSHERATGNLQMYDLYSLRALMQNSGYRVNSIHGCFLKPLSSKQIEPWDDNLLSALSIIGEEYPDLSWFLYAVCDLKN